VFDLWLIKMRSLLLLLSLVSLSAIAEVEVRDAWSRATTPGMPMGAIYAEFRNTGGRDMGVDSIKTSVAKLAEIHESVEIDGMMRMREIVPFTIPAGETVKLQPGGKHIMLMGLKNALREGQKARIEITLTDGKQIQVDFVVGGFGQMTKP
jgi:copper(I)-binding protein